VAGRSGGQPGLRGGARGGRCDPAPFRGLRRSGRRRRKTPRGWILYRRALARTSGRPGLQARAEVLRQAAADDLMKSAGVGRWPESEEARRMVDEAVSWSRNRRRSARRRRGRPRSGRQAACAERYREAMELSPGDRRSPRRRGDLASKPVSMDEAVALFTHLAPGPGSRSAGRPRPGSQASRLQLARAGEGGARPRS
jgi:hypothetical protein